ncbi:regulatory inactivation of DnaA Hda protein [Noviherbaspirillum humi]|uniref:Regulatory inactivation of DnaA Hda protein n=1 Tax=Noviherbaspirillum humi TaxID=1688639 RepID=A0A239E3S2_9BURK|nr:DnaA regulatory inactivator Hda [Noviherbaspirillum humi]SNS39247.1 regulatory inactivation of DnaA Hda protein [Noviherbaspirillum humi]
MRQMLLDLGPEKPQTLDTFVVGQNAELLQRLQGFTPGAAATEERFIYVWGEPGSGKSHLLRALARMEGARYIGGAKAKRAEFQPVPEVELYLVDDCEQLSAGNQVAAFNLYNQVKESGGLLVAAGSLPPAQLKLREDLRSRLGWGLAYRLHSLTDEEKINALTQAAKARGMALAAGVLPYLITHFHRDMRSLSAMLDALDRYSLETQRPITLPLLRDLLQLEGEPKAPEAT